MEKKIIIETTIEVGNINDNLCKASCKFYDEHPVSPHATCHLFNVILSPCMPFAIRHMNRCDECMNATNKLNNKGE